MVSWSPTDEGISSKFSDTHEAERFMAFRGKKKDGAGEHSIRDEFIRRFKTSPVLFIGTVLILVIVIVAFVFVPAIVPEAGRREELNFGSYNKAPIVYTPGNYLARAQESWTIQYGQAAQFYQLAIWRRAFDATAIHLGILDEMKQAGYAPPAETVDRLIAETPSLLAEYRQVDGSAKIALWRQVRDEMVETRYRADLEGFKVPAAEAAFIGAMASRERRFSLVSLPLSSYPDEEVAAFGRANPDFFRVIKLSRITKSSAKEAEQILGTIRGEVTSFEDAAKTYSEDSFADQGGDLGIRWAYELQADIPDETEREKVLALGKGELSPAIKVSGGRWAFFRAEEAASPADTADSASLDKIRAYLMDAERGRIEDWLIKDAGIVADLIREEGLEAALARRGLEKKDFGPLPLNYGDADLFTALSSFGSGVPELYGMSSNEGFWEAAFSTPLETPSRPLVLGTNVAILYPLEETEESGEGSKAAQAESAYTGYQLSNAQAQSIHTFFIASDKLEDRFEATYNRFFQPSF
jgi:hypothetical protein